MPEPYKPAQMPQVAFLRFLEVVAKAHWNTDPVIVNFNNEMTSKLLYFKTFPSLIFLLLHLLLFSHYVNYDI